jgi:hypothetical protein
MLYQAKARVRALAGTASGSSACSSGENGPASWPLGLSVPSTAATTISTGLRAVARTKPAAVIRNAEPSRTRRRPTRWASEATRMVNTASSTRVAVNTAPMAGAPKPRRSR